MRADVIFEEVRRAVMRLITQRRRVTVRAVPAELGVLLHHRRAPASNPAGHLAPTAGTPQPIGRKDEHGQTVGHHLRESQSRGRVAAGGGEAGLRSAIARAG